MDVHILMCGNAISRVSVDGKKMNELAAKLNGYVEARGHGCIENFGPYFVVTQELEDIPVTYKEIKELTPLELAKLIEEDKIELDSNLINRGNLRKKCYNCGSEDLLIKCGGCGSYLNKDHIGELEKLNKE